MHVLKAKHISVRAGNTHLLKQVSLSIAPGEIHAIVGPNGAGKTTFLKAISGELAYFSGELSLCGFNSSISNSPTSNPPTNSTTAKCARQQACCLGVLPQFSGLNFPFTVSEVVAMGRMPHSTGRDIDQHIIAETMQAMDISHLAQRPYTQLSGGEKQRTQLARVLAQIWRAEDAPARLLLLDEPTASLDIGHQQQLMAAVARFAQQGAGVLMVVHDINLAANYAHFILALKNGECLAQGKTDTLLTPSLLQQLFDTPLHIVPHPISQKPYVVT